MFFKYRTVNNSCVESRLERSHSVQSPFYLIKELFLLFDLIGMIHGLIDSLGKGKINLSLGMESGHEGHGWRSKSRCCQECILLLWPGGLDGPRCASACNGDKTNASFPTSGRGVLLRLGLSCIDRIAIGDICLGLYNTWREAWLLL